MAIARSRQIDASVTRWYHCVTRCVRCAFLVGNGTFDRRAWIENRIEDLAQIFAVGVGGFSVQERSAVRSFLRREPGPVAGSGRTPGCATRREPGWVSDPLTVTRF